jgi:hypothetical protein
VQRVVYRDKPDALDAWPGIAPAGPSTRSLALACSSLTLAPWTPTPDSYNISFPEFCRFFNRLAFTLGKPSTQNGHC